MATGKYNHHSHQGFQKGHRPFVDNVGNKHAVGKHRKFSDITKKKMSDAKKGTKVSEATKQKHRLRNGDLSGHWKGGVSPIHNKIRGSYEYREWEKKVFVRDNYTCQRMCGEIRKGKLTAHHLQNFAEWPELRMVVENGITLCRPCHKKFHQIYGKKGNFKEQISQFLLLNN
jgi:5-methylcytosine-specific restriction endonuclease McrA